MRAITYVYLVSFVAVCGLHAYITFHGMLGVPNLLAMTVLLGLLVFSNDMFTLTSGIHSSFGRSFSTSSQVQEGLHVVVLIAIVMYFAMASTGNNISAAVYAEGEKEMLTTVHGIVHDYLGDQASERKLKIDQAFENRSRSCPTGWFLADKGLERESVCYQYESARDLNLNIRNPSRFWLPRIYNFHCSLDDASSEIKQGSPPCATIDGSS